MVNLCAGTFATSKTCRALSSYNYYVQGNIGSACSHALRLAVGKMFSRQVLNELCNISGFQEVQGAATLLVRAVSGTAVRRLVIALEAFSDTDVFDAHVVSPVKTV